MKIDFSRGKTAIFIGSSVCEGCGATNNRGWTAMTAERMERNGWSTGNCAIGGQTTADILLRLERDVIVHKPAVCFVGLGLSNEGLATTPDPAVPCGIFLNNLKKIVQALKDAGIFPIVGGVYPNNDYTLMQYAWERRVYDEMDTWDVPVLQWLLVRSSPPVQTLRFSSQDVFLFLRKRHFLHNRNLSDLLRKQRSLIRLTG